MYNLNQRAIDAYKEYPDLVIITSESNSIDDLYKAVFNWLLLLIQYQSEGCPKLECPAIITWAYNQMPLVYASISYKESRLLVEGTPK